MNVSNSFSPSLSLFFFFFNLSLGNYKKLLHVGTREIYNYKLKARDLSPHRPLALITAAVGVGKD